MSSPSADSIVIASTESPSDRSNERSFSSPLTRAAMTAGLSANCSQALGMPVLHSGGPYDWVALLRNSLRARRHVRGHRLEREERDAGADRNLIGRTGRRGELEVAHQLSKRRDRLEHGEVLADARAWTGAERHPLISADIGVAQEAIGIEA